MISLAIPRQRVRIIKGSIKSFFLLLSGKELLRGPFLDKFEKSFARYIGAPHAIAVSSGRFALELILRALSLQEGDEVILPAYTFKAIPVLIEKMGFKVVFVDVDLQTYTMNAADVEQAITPRTRVIIATHILGNPCHMQEIMHMAKTNNIFVIEDCAQAIGAEIHGKKVGSFGDAAIFSMETIKLMHTYGGGVITVSDEQAYKDIMEYADQLETISAYRLMQKIFFTLFEHVFTRPLIFSVFIWPLLVVSECVFFTDLEKMFKRIKRDVKGMRGGRMTNYQAAMGLVELQDIDERIAVINRNVDSLKKLIVCDTQQPFISAKPVFFSFVIRTKRRDPLKKKLLLHGIDSGLESSQNCSLLFSSDGNYEKAEALDHELLQLPLRETTSYRDILRIGEYVKKWGKK